MKKLLAVSLILFLTLILTSCTKSKIAIEKRVPFKKDQSKINDFTMNFVYGTITAKDILDTYKQVKNIDDIYFHGKYMVITGVISSIGFEKGNETILSLDQEGEKEGNVVNCYFSKTDFETIKSFKKGDYVQLTGKVDFYFHFLNENGEPYFIVGVKDCHSVSLIKNK